jgi:hypothetical protein
MATQSQTEEAGGNNNHRTEPRHTEQNAHCIERFAAAISGSLASAPAIKHS